MSTPFTVVVPITVSDSNFVSSTITEADYTAYSAATTYAVGNRVIVTTGEHKIYESLQAGNIAHTPISSPTWWVQVSATNRWSAWDKSGGSYATATTSAEWVVNTGRIDSVALLDVTASTVRIVGTSTLDGIVYDQTTTLGTATELVALDIPIYGDMQIKVIVTGTGTISVGTLLYGIKTQIGESQYGAKTSIVDYSVKSVDAYGRASLVKRAYSKLMDISVWIDAFFVDAVKNKLDSLRATSCLWVGSKGNYEVLSVYGFYRDYKIEISYNARSILNITVEGLS